MEEFTIIEAAIHFEVDKDDLYLMLSALEIEFHPDGSAPRAVSRRAVLDGKELKVLYRRDDIEAALALRAAKLLGYGG